MALALLSSVAFAQKRELPGPPINTPMQPWVGEMGITETVDQIMARELATPIFEGPRPFYFGPEHEFERTWVRPNPQSPRVASWPPAAVGGRDSKKSDPIPGGRGGGGIYSPQTIGTSFLGSNVSESGALPPDSMGAVGPTQILVCVNGRIKVFDRNGVLGPLNTTDRAFFNSVRNGADVSDPQVRYDRLSQRWFVLMITTVSSSNRIVLAVSSGPIITGTSSFTFFQFQQDQVAPVGNLGQFADYCSLGVDANALYVGCNMFNGSFGCTGWVIRKSSVLGAGPIVATAFRNMASGNGPGPYSPRGVDNDDPAATEGYFIGVDNATFGTLMIRRISNPGGSPSISGNLAVTVPSTWWPMDVTPLGSNFPVDSLDDRLFYATIRKNRITGQSTLWTSHNIRVNGSGVASSSGNRTGSRWYQLQNMTGTPSLLQSGTLFDSAGSQPKSYWIPSTNMNGQGHMATGVSMAGASQRADAAFAGRWSGDSLGSIRPPTQATFTGANYNAQSGGTQRWGDYSMTWVDPNDDMTMWTFQEYCYATNWWGVRIVELRSAPPATIATLVPSSINQGQTLNIVVNGTSSNGSGFFDPGNEFPNRLAASFSGSGLTVNGITFTSPTQFTMNVTASGAAAPGARNLTVTNPDGQTSSLGSALTVNASGLVTVNPSSFVAFPGILESGGLSDLFLSDNLYVRVRRNLAAEEVGFPITMTVTGTSPTANPTSFQFRVEARSEIVGLQQSIELYDFSANQWVSLDVRAAPLSDTVVTVAGTGSLARFVQAGTRTIRARVGIDEVAIDSVIAWRSWFDQLVWLIGQ